MNKMIIGVKNMWDSFLKLVTAQESTSKQHSQKKTTQKSQKRSNGKSKIKETAFFLLKVTVNEEGEANTKINIDGEEELLAMAFARSVDRSDDLLDLFKHIGTHSNRFIDEIHNTQGDLEHLAEEMSREVQRITKKVSQPEKIKDKIIN